jgi:hypothetical protein
MDHHNNSVSLASIVIDKRFQTRAAMDQGAIADYADAIRQIGCWPFPPIKVVRQVLVDGFHRIEAARRVIAAPETPADLRKALQTIPCERVAVDPASNDISDLALQHALAANHTHGLRRSNADKRRAVELAQNRWPDKSDREIAKLTGTSHTFAGTVRGELQVATLPRESEPESALDDLREVATLPLESETESAPNDPWEVETLPRAKQRACGGSDEHRPNPEEAAKKVRSIADQHRDKLVRAIDDYHEHKPNARERDRLVKLVQGVDLW